jgi:hypothetical protein
MDSENHVFPSPIVYVTGLQYLLKNVRFEIEKNQQNLSVDYFKDFVQRSLDIAKFALDHIINSNDSVTHPMPDNQLWKFYNFISQNYMLCAELLLAPQDQEAPLAKISHHIDCVWEILSIWEGFIYHNHITLKLQPK